MDVNSIIVYGFGGWSTVHAIPTLGFGIGESAWTDPSCTITTGITMGANTLSDDVVIGENPLALETLTAAEAAGMTAAELAALPVFEPLPTTTITTAITMSANTLSDDISMGC